MLKVVFLATLLLCAASVEATEITLKNADFEQPIVGNRIPGWSRTQHAGIRAYEITNDVASFAHGKQSIRMRRTVEQVYGLILQQVQTDAVAGKEIELKASLKTAEVGGQGWVMLLNFMNHNNVIDQQRATPVVGDNDWADVTLRKMAPPNTTAIQIGFMLLDGGSGWVDNVRVRTIDRDTKKTEAKIKSVTPAKLEPAASKNVKQSAKPIAIAPKRGKADAKSQPAKPNDDKRSR